ncbi:MAG: hypothetical protein CUN55_11085 [Phototrophicales bacterium]|nr:MAG: hypothetical protein CUN55_11085 [Phototrophicales bacterium]
MTDMQADIHHLATVIGARPPLSQEADAAADYVFERLQKIGVETWREPFFSPHSTWQQIQPQIALGLIGLALTTRGKSWVRQLGLPLIGLAVWGGKQTLDGQSAWWEFIVPEQRAENVLGRIPAQEETRHRVVLIAHLDTEKVRFSAQPIVRQLMTVEPVRALQHLMIWGATLPVHKSWRWMRRLIRLAMISVSLLMGLDRLSDYSDGANDNASGVAVLLSLAEQLALHPLPYTEVIFAFTTSDTVNGRGSAELAANHLKEWQDAYWIVLDSVGSGEVCWVKENISEQPEYSVVHYVEAAAQKHRADGIMGRTLAVLNPSRPLLAHHLNAVAIMGYDRADNVPVGWHRAEDSIAIINQETLEKTKRFVQTIIQIINEQAPEKVQV